MTSNEPRDQFIPVRKADLLDEPAAEKADQRGN
jgi:hypothetical protein